MEWMLMPYRRYFDFSGRSRRKEFWMFMLFIFLVSIVLGFVMVATMGVGLAALQGGANPLAMSGSMGIVGIILVIFALATIIPSIAVQVRRLHDLNQTGWLLLGAIIVLAVLNAIPKVGGILYLIAYVGWLVYLAMPGTAGANKYGTDPKDPTGAEVFA